MKLEELRSMIVRAYGQVTDQGIMLGMITGRDVCVSQTGPFKCELVGPSEFPSFHGEKAYKRYHIATSNYGESGKAQ